MSAISKRRERPGFAIISFVCCLFALPVQAADTSEWKGDSRSAVRLIAGAPDKAGIEIRLAPGWKTYWRYPGDAGVPPQFDFSGSDNLKSAQVAWPAPLLFTDQEGSTIGYKGNVILPLHIEAVDPVKPVMLRAKIDYAICEKLCVPADAKTELQLGGGSDASKAALADAERRVPLPLPLKANAPLSIAGVMRSGAKVSVDVIAPQGPALTLFAEGPAPDWSLPLPQPVAGAQPGQQRFEFALDGLPPGSKPDGAEIKLTAVSGERAIETTFRLD